MRDGFSRIALGSSGLLAAKIVLSGNVYLGNANASHHVVSDGETKSSMVFAVGELPEGEE